MPPPERTAASPKKSRKPGMFARASAASRSMLSGAGSAGRLLMNSMAVLLLIALACGWYFGREALERRVAELTTQKAEVRFNWPIALAPGARKPATPQTWLPPAVQRDLARIAAAEVAVDPFAQDSLERARQALLATGWFANISSVRRTPGGHIDITADWRLPAAVVQHRNREYLVAVGGEVLRLPPRTPVQKGSMPTITNPRLAPRSDSQGIVYGAVWPGGDVEAAIDLLRNLRQIPEVKRLVGVDLANYIETGHLTLVTDAGARIVWGSALSELGPGEVSVDTRRARLRDILQTRFDQSQRTIEIHTPVVLVDKTAAAN
ncbi:MAG: hypothetical protein JNK58_12525 [Phycisphaerae bacterium]|nr:hypothetical protein [Phycisphaerae bacterium]